MYGKFISEQKKELQWGFESDFMYTSHPQLSKPQLSNPNRETIASLGDLNHLNL